LSKGDFARSVGLAGLFSFVGRASSGFVGDWWDTAGSVALSSLFIELVETVEFLRDD
jgi:hypothetical protein